ncbi:homoserine dehydrogenase [Halobacillus sp. A1]|uniref:homoserine dehydrogenase n=1 Tax=Halobacillus sp. A1 TaxID=2880262 RepID=UPI0021158EEF|nr:homoserine dehydrogenase [Halobacillus sp. A1]
MTIKAALLGFGTVGQGVYEILEEKQQDLQLLLGRPVEVVGILVNDMNKSRPVRTDTLVTDRFEQILEQQPDVIFEATIGQEPGYSYIKQALNEKIHVVTANKVMFAAHGEDILEVADYHDAGIGYEATTAAGTPIIGTLSHLLQINKITKVEAILNGTSNYILTAMQQDGKSFSEALQEAKDKGYAEADPANDIDGHDAFYKLMILSQLLHKKQPVWSDVPLKGISQISPEDLTEAAQKGEKIRHVAALELINGELSAQVKPVSLPASHGLHSIDGVDNAITVSGDLVGSVTLRGPGAGKRTTASAMVEDSVRILQSAPIYQLQ